jgi:hypothetical protein
MSIRIVVPKLRLAQLLRMPGGLPVVDAVANAERNLATLRPTCEAELLALLELCEQSFATLGEEFDDAGLEKIYAIAVRGIGGGRICGAPAVDTALISLCDLIDHLRSTARYDRKAVGVHVSSWRLLMGAGLPEAGAAAVLDGLQRVSLRYAEAPRDD